MRNIGVHLRMQSTICDVPEKAFAYGMSIFQFFLVSAKTGRVLTVSAEQERTFLTQWRDKFNDIYVHGSYRTNLANMYRSNHPVFTRELSLAQRLSCTHIVMHPGYAKGVKTKYDGIVQLARNLNTILAVERDISIVLENTVGDAMMIGSDLYDFYQLCMLLDYPEKVSFCIDTAHAYLSGYDITHKEGIDDFINQIDATVGLDKVVLLHINDTVQKVRSGVDQHAMIGQGALGNDILQQFTMHPLLAHLPIILEPPFRTLETGWCQSLQRVHEWHVAI